MLKQPKGTSFKSVLFFSFVFIFHSNVIFGLADSHRHGVATGTMAISKSQIQIELSIPADSLVGFEHTPKTKAEKLLVAKAKLELENASFFKFFKRRGLMKKKQTMDLSLITQRSSYSNDVVNIQNELKAGLTVNNFDYLPLWMQTPQSVVRGFRLALPIKYLKPGAGSQALYRLKNEINYDPKQLDIDIDRLIIDDNLGTTFNDLSRITYTGDGSTTIFTSPYRVTKPNHLIITVDGLGVTDFNMIGDITTDTPHISSDTELYSTNNDSPSNPQISFNHAPINGSTINVGDILYIKKL